MGIKIENNAASTLAAGIGTSDTSISLASGGGSLFPTLGAGDYFWATLISSLDPSYVEIVKVTARTGDSLTVLRAQEGTAAKAFSTNDKFEMRITAQTMRDYSDAANLTGVLSIAQGGTGQTTEAGVRSTLNVPTRTGGDASGTWGISVTGNAATATALATGRTIGMTGDVTWTSASFDGSGNVTGTATLANSGVTAGTYRSVTVDTKGRVTSGTNPTTLSGYGITDAQPLDADLTAIAGLSGTTGFLKKTAANTWSLDTNSYLTGNQSISISGDASGSGATSISLTLANSGVTAGTYTKVTVDSKGRVTTGANLASGDLPTYTGTITSSQVTTALGYTPYNSTNPSGYITGITSGMVTTALGYTPYNSSNPSGYITSSALSSYLPLSGGTLTGTTYFSGANGGLQANYTGGVSFYGNEINAGALGTTGSLYIANRNTTEVYIKGNVAIHAGNYNSYAPTLTGGNASGTWSINVTGSAGSVAWTNVSGRPTALSSFTNDSGYITGISSGMVTSALGYTPYSSAGGTVSGSVTATGRFIGNSLLFNSYGTWVGGDAGGASIVNSSESSYQALMIVGNSSAGGSRRVRVWDEFYVMGSVAQGNGRQILHAGNYTSYSPSLGGSGASGTWGISITGNAGTAYGLDVHSGRNNEVNKVVRTDQFGYIQAGWINTTSGDNGTTAIDRVYASSDGYIRYYTPANFRAVLDVPTRGGSGASGTWSINITGNAATVTNGLTTSNYSSYSAFSGLVSSSGNNGFANATYYSSVRNPIWYFGNASSYGISYYQGSAGIGGTDTITLHPNGSVSAGGGTFATNSNNSWVNGNIVLHAGNYTSYSPSLGGSGASGTWGINITGSAGSASSASSVPASGITGQAGMWTSAGRPGPYRLYRNDDNSAYNIQTTWSVDRSGCWSLRGYLNDGYHAPCYVAYSGYADSAGSATITASQISATLGYTPMANLGYTPVQQGGGGSQGTNKVYIGWMGSNIGLQVDSTNFGATWPINVSGSAGSVSGGLTTSNYSSYALPISGGTMTGTISSFANSIIIGYATGSPTGYIYNDSSAFGFLTNGGAWANYQPMGTNNWHSNGNISASGNVTAYSDERLKKDWLSIPDGFIEKLATLKSGTYSRIDRDQRQAGVSAQDVQEFLPEVVEEDHKGNLTLAYGNLAMVSVVELAKEIVTLKKELAAIKYQVSKGD